MSTNPSDRTLLSRRTLEGWKRQAPTGKVEDLLRMIGGEMAVLADIAKAHPAKAETIEGLIGGWRDFAAKLRMRMD